MFERNALIELRQWAAWPGYKPMVLRGARQVGKTTLVDQFAAEYDVYLKLNLEKNTDRRLFESGMSMDELNIWLSVLVLSMNFSELLEKTA